MPNVRHIERSIAYSDHSKPNNWLWSLGLRAAVEAGKSELRTHDPDAPDAQFLNVYPGEHYRLLAALVRLLDEPLVVEVGTFTGLATSVMHAEGAVVHTFDILPWRNFRSHLTQAMFDTGGVTQHLDDLAVPELFDRHYALLNSADLLFLDGPKDNYFEHALMTHLQKLLPKPNRLIVMDDIRLMNMVELWGNLPHPKMDMTSLGHWSGTGLVDYSQP
ncbi:MAG: hypothetical protein WCC69_10255 [Pirellulales bacterium]